MFSNLFFKKNRKKLTDLVVDNSLVFFHAKDPFIKGDDTFYSQIDSNLFYFSGIEQENSILLISKINNKTKSILFIVKQDKNKIIWEGEKLNKKSAKKISGVDRVLYFEELNKYIEKNMDYIENIYFDKNQIYYCKSSSDIILDQIKERYNYKNYKEILPIIKKLRRVKKDIEIKAIQKAIKISKKAYINVIKNIKNYKYEAEIEGEITKVYTSNFSQHAFHPIVATGKNAITLHYLKNNSKIKNKDLILIDTGCEFENYKSDITRVIPANGKFSKRQKQVYESVLNIQKYAFSCLKPGIERRDYELRVIKKTKEELVKLKLLSENCELKEVQKYFPHSTSHMLGLDTHDCGDYESVIKEGEVLTVEPGIYIEKEGIGIRIEDNVLITKNGCKNLSKGIPKSVEKIEELASKYKDIYNN